MEKLIYNLYAKKIEIDQNEIEKNKNKSSKSKWIDKIQSVWNWGFIKK